MLSARVKIKFKERNSNIKFKLFMLQFLGTGIKSILAFITGTPLKPKEETVGFLPDEKGHSWPDPDTCACSLKIPTCFSTYGQFEAAADATVRIQGKGFGRAVPVVI